MELLKAIDKLNVLKNDAKNLDKWFSEVKLDRPVNGSNWVKLRRAVDGVLDDMYLEANTLEIKIKEVTKELEIDI